MIRRECSRSVYTTTKTSSSTSPIAITTALAVVAAGIVPLNGVAAKNSARILEVETTFGEVLVALGLVPLEDETGLPKHGHLKDTTWQAYTSIAYLILSLSRPGMKKVVVGQEPE